MSQASLLTAPATATSGTRLETGAVVLVLIAFAALLLVRAKQNRDQKIRKAASVGYFDADAARYLRSPDADATSRPEPEPAETVLAPTFVAPVRGRTPGRGARVASPPVATTYGVAGGVPPLPVPAFDHVVAIANRPTAFEGQATPVTPLPPPPPPPPPAAPTGATQNGSGPSLPRLVPPAPPGRPHSG